MLATRVLRRLSRLTFAEALLLCEAQYAVVACQVARWRRPTGQLLRVEDLPPSGQAPEPADMDEVASSAWAISVVSALGIVRPLCLVRSLALQRMLRRRGVNTSELKFGFRVRDGALEAHAWIELEGMVVGDSRSYVSRFTPATSHRLVEA